jgi:hypothetical protein
MPLLATTYQELDRPLWCIAAGIDALPPQVDGDIMAQASIRSIEKA